MALHDVDPLSALRLPFETGRHRVRRVDERDLVELLAVSGDAEVTRYLPYDTWRSLDDAHAWLDRTHGFEGVGRSRQFVVESIEGEHAGRVIGTVVLFNLDPAARRAEIGYVLGRAHWGRGVMREVIAALVARAFADLELVRLEAFVDARNAASGRLLVGLGFTHEGTLRRREVLKGEHVDSQVYGLLRSDRVPTRE